MIIMIDTETTSLSAFSGVAHQLAYHAIMPNFSDAWDEPCYTIAGEMQVDLLTTTHNWDEDTYIWAKRNGTLPEIHLGGPNPKVATIRAEHGAKWLKHLMDTKAKAGKMPVSVVFKHPEFDIPFLEKEGIFIRDLFGHRNIYDLTSLVRGFYAGFHSQMSSARSNQQLTEAHFKVDKVPHTALADCRLQMAQLRKANYGGLL